MQQMLDDAIAHIANFSPNVVSKGTGREGSPADVLIEASKGADLLVVGSRGLGEFSGLLLGSVSQRSSL
jgi:nucleotide-binding universal stress UspA family protein